MMKNIIQKITFGFGLALLFMSSIQCTQEKEGSNGYAYVTRAAEQEKEEDCKEITEENEEECKKIAEDILENIKAAKELADLMRGIIIDDDPRPCPEIGTCMPMPALLRPAIFLDKAGITYSIRMVDANNKTIAESYQDTAPKDLQMYSFKLSNPDYIGQGKVFITKLLKGKSLRTYKMDVKFVKE